MGTLVGTPQSTYSASAATSINHSYGTAVASGDVALVCGASYHGTATISSVTSSVATSSITEVGSLLRPATSETLDPFLGVYLLVFSAAGTPTFTVNFSASVGDRSIRSIVYSGIDTTTPEEATAGASTATDAGGTITVATGNIVQGNIGPIASFMQEYAWAAAHNHNVGTPNTGWTEWGDTATGADNKYQNFTSTGTRNGDFTYPSAGGSDFWCVRGVALRDSSGEPPPTVVPLLMLMGIGT